MEQGSLNFGTVNSTKSVVTIERVIEVVGILISEEWRRNQK